jgi:hypothetical protein
MAALGNVDIFVRSGPRADPYFHLPLSDPSIVWWKVWFYLRNVADASLPVFMVSRPVPEPKWGYGVARKDLHRIQPLRDIIEQLL